MDNKKVSAKTELTPQQVKSIKEKNDQKQKAAKEGKIVKK